MAAALERNGRVRALAACATTAKDFTALWREAFRPLREWASACAACVAAEVRRDYREFRLGRGAITYPDQVAFAAELLRLPEVAKRIRGKHYRVILDEAQDTDPQEFFVLLEMTRPVGARGEWFFAAASPGSRGQDGHQGPRPGHFLMGGGFRESIYFGPPGPYRFCALSYALLESCGAAGSK